MCILCYATKIEKKRKEKKLKIQKLNEILPQKEENDNLTIQKLYK